MPTFFRGDGDPLSRRMALPSALGDSTRNSSAGSSYQPSSNATVEVAVLA
jgi:hypothetical protein